jgi:hypothetical protein
MDLSPELNLDVELRLRQALARFEKQIASVFVRLTDVNGPDGGPDKQCTILVSLRGTAPFLVQTRPMELDAAVDTGVRRLRTALRRLFDRRKPRRSLPRLRPAGV